MKLCKLIGHSAKFDHSVDPTTHHEPIKCRWCGAHALCEVDRETNTYEKPHGWVSTVKEFVG